MKVIKIINNNIISSVDEKGNEIIATGRGIGFKKKSGEEIDDSAVEKIYRMSSVETQSKLKELVEEIPLEVMNVCSDLVDYFKANLKSQVNEKILITLTDHINFAIERTEKGLLYPNTMLTEIRQYYPEEYKLGLYATEHILQKLGCKLSDDEAGFIALHIVNSELDTNMSDMVKITEMIDKIIEIVENYFGDSFNKSSVYFDRFVVHLKFFGQRLFGDCIQTDRDASFQEVIRKSCPQAYECSMLIAQMIERDYGKTLSGEEAMYLTIHLKRINMID